MSNNQMPKVSNVSFFAKMYPAFLLLKSHANSNPKITVLILFSTMISSLAMMFFWSNKESDLRMDTAIHAASDSTHDVFFNDLSAQGDFSLSSVRYIYMMQKLQDTLNYLMSKGDQLTKEDKLTFVRVMEQFVSIDTVSKKYIDTEYLKSQIENDLSRSNDSFMNAYPMNNK